MENAARSLDTVVAELVDLIAERVEAKLHAEYTQDALPPGMSKRSYLEHCAAKDWPCRKDGRLRITRRPDFDAWKVSRTTRTRADAEAGIDYDAALRGRRA